MVRVDDATIIRYEKQGHRFEILADPDAVLAIREGKEVDLREAFAIVEVFKDARKADKASEETMQKVFGTINEEEIVLRIAKEGDFHLTTEQKRKIVEKIRKQIIESIARNSIDPRTKLPHTRERIELALEKAPVNIDMRPAMQQVQDVVKSLQPILPISFGKARLRIVVPAQYSQSTYGLVHKLGNVLREDWLADGSLQVRLEIPSGTKVDVMEQLGNAAKGEITIQEV